MSHLTKEIVGVKYGPKLRTTCILYLTIIKIKSDQKNRKARDQKWGLFTFFKKRIIFHNTV